jgi:hypothetical protein
MVELLSEAAVQMPNYAKLAGKLPGRLEGLHREAEAELRKTAGGWKSRK